MASSNSSPGNIFGLSDLSKESLDRLPEDPHIWENLKTAIATSSGFRRWQLEQNTDGRLDGCTLDQIVHRYLRETLETLAY